MQDSKCKERSARTKVQGYKCKDKSARIKVQVYKCKIASASSQTIFQKIPSQCFRENPKRNTNKIKAATARFRVQPGFAGSRSRFAARLGRLCPEDRPQLPAKQTNKLRRSNALLGPQTNQNRQKSTPKSQKKTPCL